MSKEKMASHQLKIAGIRMVRMDRVYQVFRAKDGLCVGCWNDEAKARAAFAKRANDRLVTLDEFRGCALPDMNHHCRVVVAEEGKVRTSGSGRRDTAAREAVQGRISERLHSVSGPSATCGEALQALSLVGVGIE